jgi:hypothetical protein
LAEGEGKTEIEFKDFLTDVSSAVEEALGSPEWREVIARSILKYEAEGYSTKRLEDFLEGDEVGDADSLVDAYERDVATLREIEAELSRFSGAKPSQRAFRDPDRIGELRELLSQVRKEQLAVDEFFLDSEKVVWDWPVIEDRLIDSWDDGDQG